MSEGTADRQLRERARAVIPGGMYGHQAAPGAGYPQFMRGGRGARVWDVDGSEYVDLMCSYGPVVLGHQHPAVEAAARAQAETGDCMNSPGPVMVDLAELLVATVQHADWAIFAKNGTDATTMCCTIARAQTGRSKILVATGAYHGAAPWCTPRPAGVTADHANLGYYTFNDLASARQAAAAAGVLWGLGLSVVLGMIALIGFTIAIPDLKTVASAPLPLLAIAGYWLPSWLVKVFVAFVVFSMFAIPFHGSDKVLGYGLALAALWYFGGLLWRLKKGTAGVKPVEDLAGPPEAG